MKNLIPRFAFGACVCLIVSCLVGFNFQSQAAPPAQAQSAQIETQRADASPVAVPEPSPKAASFYRSTIFPWETGQSSKYEKYFRPAEESAGPPVSSAQINEH
jgi:hypothetical protein